jgi:tRNA A-37 threonylcarbamoyl transferase component Bud32/tetratricopeptide (TPR) repeat protein
VPVMPADLDVAQLDERLESLLDLTLAERELRLLDLEQTEPELAVLLRKLLRLATDAQTADLRQAGDGLAFVDERLPPPLIEGYRIEGEIASGGMATVYAAERDIHGLARPVAIKLLRTAVLSPLDRERFLNEQRILARLQHPNIATLLDVGVVNDRPYMVMERIEGDPIDQRLKVEEVGPRVILSGFLQVLDAVALAHSHFVIHRDIKPDNVLVDADGRVRLIDFGIAKILDESGGLRSDPTLTGLAPMTLRYASPEQLGGRPVGVASDVYQLGLLLYHLLTGAWPYDEGPKELPSARARPDGLPQPASTRVSDRGLKRALQGDLDSILLKCLRFEPADRYLSVVELREDLERHLDRRPVRARRQTRGYRLRSFVRRHPLGVGLVAAAVVLVLAGALFAVILAQRAQEYAAQSERILDTVTEMFAPANPFHDDYADQITVAEAVERSAARFLQEVDADPLFQIAMLERLGKIKQAFRDHAGQRLLLERGLQLAEQHALAMPIRARLAAGLAETQFGQGDYTAADELIARMLPLADREHRTRLRYVQTKIAIERGEHEVAEGLFEQLYADLETVGLEPLFQSQVHVSHAILLSRTGNMEQSANKLRQAIALLDENRIEHQEALLSIPVTLAVTLGRGGDYAGSEREFRRALEMARTKVGPTHSATAHAIRNYSTLLGITGRFETAYDLLASLRDSPAEQSERLAQAHYRGRLAQMAFYTGRVEEAMAARTDELVYMQEVTGSQAEALSGPLAALAWQLFEIGELELAAAYAREASRRGERDRELVSQIGVLLAPDPAAAASAIEPLRECAATQLDALIRLQSGAELQTHVLPDSCNGATAMRLVSLGYAWAPPWGEGLTREDFRSPLIARLRDPANAVPLGAEQRARIEGLLQQLQWN